VVTEGRLDVFRRTDEIEAIDTAVLLLTDISGSMSAGLGDGVSAIDAADATTRALGDTLDRFDIPFAVRYFGEALTLGKSFEEPWRSAKNRHWARLEGSTCTHQALYTCVPEIAARDEQRKLLILVTDGVPSDSETTAVVLMEAMRAGVQPAVVLIAAHQSGSTAYFAHLLRDCGVAVAWAQDPQSLSQVVFDAVKETLTDSRRKLRAA
jgi:cobalamin biosynthesis protein CobT